MALAVTHKLGPSIRVETSISGSGTTGLCRATISEVAVGVVRYLRIAAAFRFLHTILNNLRQWRVRESTRDPKAKA